MVVTDLGEYPGRELRTEAGEAQQDFGVGMVAQSGLRCFGELVGGLAGSAQSLEEREQLNAHGAFDGWQLASLVGAEDAAEVFGFGFYAALAAGPLQGCPQLGQGQPGADGGCRCGCQDGAGVWAGQAVLLGLEGVQGGRVVLAQMRPDLVDELLAGPDGVLLGAGEDGDGLDLLGVGGQWPVGVHVGAQDVCQHEGVAGVGLLAGDAVPVAVSGGGKGVDGEELALAGPQRGNQQPPLVSIATGIGSSGVSPYSASSPRSRR